MFVVIAVGEEEISSTVTFGDEFDFGRGEVIVCRTEVRGPRERRPTKRWVSWAVEGNKSFKMEV